MTEEPQPLPIDTPPVVGQVYLVPCLVVAGDGKDDQDLILPVIGPRHADPGHGINVPLKHFHADVRFRGNRDLSALLTHRALARGDLTAALRIAFAPPEEVAAMAAMNLIHLDDHRPVTLRPLRCEREAPMKAPSHWQRELEAAYAGKTLSADGRCPHQGALVLDQPLRDGRRVCPLHGLCFDQAGRQCPAPSAPPSAPPSLGVGLTEGVAMLIALRGLGMGGLR